MYYVHLMLNIKTGELYIGYTNNVDKRIAQHNTNKPKEGAKTREHRLKYYGQVLNEVKKRISGSLQLAKLVRGQELLSKIRSYI